MKMRLARGNIKESSGLHKKEEALHKTFIKELQVSRKITKQIVEKGSDANFEMLVFLRANRELSDFTSLLGFHEAADEDAE
ncbi:hypothetical protein AM587_10017297 [Phytophthora nicotianae]|uniref:Uncharacterized protein n=1 Tax=Phytophthora nicotianae TaxID=4792 RepID=A0A0W8CQB5_PHYNI|nr:hypothetical protein AM587_10017297 [Phytophthora nicotianae]